MASIYRRKGRDGKPLPNWHYHFTDHTGKRVGSVGVRDKTATRAIAEHREAEAKLVRVGLKEPKDLSAEQAARVGISKHVSDYQLALLDKGDTECHARHIASAISRLLEDAGADRLPKIAQESIQAALRRLKDKRSARTANYALGAIKAFLRWCDHTGRITGYPRWLGAIKPYPEASDRRRVRRVLTPEEIERLLITVETGPDQVCYGRTRKRREKFIISGRDRAMFYRLALGTGLRDKELRSLTPEDIDLVGAAVRCRADNTKNGQEAMQPIDRNLCKRLHTWFASRLWSNATLFVLPWSSSEMLQRDLARAGIPCSTKDGIVDMHSFRHTYISSLIEKGVDPKTVQVLARHSTITLTIDRYSHTSEARKRKAIEGEAMEHHE